MERTPSARRAVTSHAIEQAAVRLVAEHGFDAVTVDQICEAAGISQRTFFNHFPTKVAAVLGSGPPRVNEEVVRRFLASENPRLIDDLLLLGTAIAPIGADAELARTRFGIVTKTPSLLAAEMERLTSVHAELTDVLMLRLRRASPGESEAELHAQAALLSHLLAGILRYSIEGGPGASPQQTREVLHALLPKLL